MANRTRPYLIKDDKYNIIASITYPSKKIHAREFYFQENNIQIIDTINSNINCKAYLHFHPSINVFLTFFQMCLKFWQVILMMYQNYIY